MCVIGGFNGTARLSTGGRFDPEMQSWHFIREMNHSRSNFGLEIIDDMIFAIGGFNGVSTISHTECYVAESDEWMEATDMNIVRSALSANNVVGLLNKRDYIHKERDRLMEDRDLDNRRGFRMQLRNQRHRIMKFAVPPRRHLLKLLP